MRSVILRSSLAAVVTAAVAVTLLAGARPAPREITLEAREMAFYLPGDPAPNPTLEVAAGERVALRLVNADPGRVHDVAAGDLGVDSGPVRSGDEARVAFTAPGRPGSYDYVCTYHARLMRGTLRVR